LERSLDLVAIGRAGVDLYGRQVGGRLEDMASFAKYVGGSPTNTAIGIARLGLRSALITKVGADHMGRFIVEQLEREGVETSAISTDPDRLTGLVILGIRDRDRFPLLFYRENCADMALKPGDVDEALLGKAAALLINGTHLSTPDVFATSMKAVELARSHGAKVVLDIDYRPVLWGLTEKDMGENRFVASADVTSRLEAVLPSCDLIVGTEEEFHILGGQTDTVDALANVRGRTGALLICKLGANGCIAIDGPVPADLTGGLLVSGFPVEVFNVLGAGDAFMAGFLSGWLRDEPIERCCILGNACGAIVVSRHGCAPAMPTSGELAEFLARENLPFRLREDEALEHIHWSTTRSRQIDELTVLAVDHRNQFEELAEAAACSPDRIADFKQLAFRALNEVAHGDDRFGIIIDDRFGFDVLAAAADTSYWVGRPIETPKSRPVEFEGGDDVGLELLTWPAKQVVKCLVFYSVNDPPQIRDRQERQLQRLFTACRETGHELLLEILPPADSEGDEGSTEAAIGRLYEIGIKPDWWKLAPSANRAQWGAIVQTIERSDPYCRGIVLLGLSAPIDDLKASFETAASFEAVKGFAVGRTIFHDVAREWLGGDISDKEAVARMAAHLSELVTAWRSARQRREEVA
jgi:5-dehydro-2-deoxygluconokinase